MLAWHCVKKHKLQFGTLRLSWGLLTPLLNSEPQYTLGIGSNIVVRVLFLLWHLVISYYYAFQKLEKCTKNTLLCLYKA